jgi:hypothetical protein
MYLKDEDHEILKRHIEAAKKLYDKKTTFYLINYFYFKLLENNFYKKETKNYIEVDFWKMQELDPSLRLYDFKKSLKLLEKLELIKTKKYSRKEIWRIEFI